jgi:6-phosphogluconolactonase
MQETNLEVWRSAAVVTHAATMKVNIRQTARCVFVVAVSVALTACGGGSGAVAPISTPVTPPPSSTYTVGGTVTGLAGPGLVLQSNFGGNLAITASGSFTFGAQLVGGREYAVGITINPRRPLLSLAGSPMARESSDQRM